MELIGMLDSPYVRRVAVTLHLLEQPFVHRPISVFSAFAQFQAINPVVKAPTLVCDDGTVLMDSTLILDYLETLAAPRSLMPAALGERQQALRLLGLALVACEKSVQIVYEQKLRPADKQHQPWLERVNCQLHLAWDQLEQALQSRPLSLAPLDQAGLTLAVAWRFGQHMIAGLLPPERWPLVAAFSGAAEQLPAFIATQLE